MEIAHHSASTPRVPDHFQQQHDLSADWKEPMEPRDVWLWLQWYLRFWLPGLQGWQRMFQFIHSQVFWSATWPDTLELASKNARYVRTTQQSVLFITPFTDPLYQTMKEHKAARLCKRAAFSLLHTLAINQQRWTNTTNTTSQLVFDRGWSRKACSLGYDVDVPRHSEHFVVKVLSGLCNARMNSASSSVHLGSKGVHLRNDSWTGRCHSICKLCVGKSPQTNGRLS